MGQCKAKTKAHIEAWAARRGAAPRGNKWRPERVCSVDNQVCHFDGTYMPIALDHFRVDPQTKPVLSVALERTRASLGLTDDLADGIIANQLIQFVKAGERNLDQLCADALNKLRGHLFGD